MNFRVAINTSHKNKMPAGLNPFELQKWWRAFNGDFKNFSIPIEHFVRAITKGYAYTAQHNNYRKAENFLCGQHVGLDFDTGDHLSSIEGILQDDFIHDNAAFIHTTASHTDKHPRARAVFILERPIYSVEKYSLLTEAFAETYKTNGHADPSCKDPVRLFFGAENCTVVMLDNLLSLKDASTIVLPHKQSRERSTASVASDVATAGSPEEFSRMLKSLVTTVLTAPDGTKWHTLVRVSRTLGGYVASGYIDEGLAFTSLYNAISSRSSVDNLKVAEDTINWGLRVGQQHPLDLDGIDDPIASALFGVK